MGMPLPAVLVPLLTPLLTPLLVPFLQGQLPPPEACALAAARRPVAAAANLIPAGMRPAVVRATSGNPEDYRDRLASTPLGWPRLDRWCIWVETVQGAGTRGPWEQRWLMAVEAALGRWQALLPIRRVSEAEAAQVLILRRRPPLQRDGSGRTRASHGRAILRLEEVQRQGIWRLEPRVEVLLSPDQRLEASEATALHELGHAFGLWGHSDDPEDAMAAVPGARPVLELSQRDRATLRWLYAQPTRFGKPLSPPPDPVARRAPGSGEQAGEGTPRGQDKGQQEPQQLHDHHAGTRGEIERAGGEQPRHGTAGTETGGQ